MLFRSPENSTAVGVPARIVRVGGEKLHSSDEVDQIHITDPVQKELQALSSRLEFVEKLLDTREKFE